MHILLIHHFYFPDEVISSRLFADLAEGLAERGARVTVLTSNRTHGDANVNLPSLAEHRGVRIVRVSRPPLSQGNPGLRLVNSAILLRAFASALGTLGPWDACIVGTDPAFLPLLGPTIRARAEHAKLFLWCFDVYPDALFAAAPAFRFLSRHTSMHRALDAYDELVVLGEDMRARLGRGRVMPLWSADEPRARLPMPDGPARLLYFGNLGRAHDPTPFAKLRAVAPALRISFACHGKSAHEARAMGFSVEPPPREPEAARRMWNQAHVHCVSVRKSFRGIVMPAKFTTALAHGRGVLFAGDPESDMARLVETHKLGAILCEPYDRVARALDDRDRVRAWGDNAARYYDAHLARAIGFDAWAKLLGLA